jgi:cobalt/nickel transport system permease protein
VHVPDGFLSPVITIPAYAAAAPLWAWGAKRHFGPDRLEALPVIGSLTALAFVIQTIMIPIPGGTSTHMLGVPLLALMFHPMVAFVCESLVLLLQALLFGAGGVTVLGVNALAMGLLGPLTAWLVFRGLRRWSVRVAAFLAAWVGMQVASLAAAAVLGLQHWLDPAYFPAPFPVVLAATVLPALTVAGVAEGAYTLVALRLLEKANLRGLPPT